MFMLQDFHPKNNDSQNEDECKNYGAEIFKILPESITKSLRNP